MDPGTARRVGRRARLQRAGRLDDYAVDLEREADKAEETLRALEAERELILGLKAALERDTDAGKYRE